jgi:ubiquinone/menaquinone biosynthesis C-methylase UbiE
MARLAKIYDQEVLPIWSQRFARLLLRDLAIPAGAQVLDFPCATGYVTSEVLRRLHGDSRLIAIDESSALLEVARRKTEGLGANARVFFRSEKAQARLSFADGVYDVVLCNVFLGESDDPIATLTDLARVTKTGGQVRCTLPFAGTFQEFYDIFREVLTKLDKRELIQRLDQHLTRYPTPDGAAAWMREAGMEEEARIVVERFSILFRSPVEFFFAPVIEYGPLRRWKSIAGGGDEQQEIFRRIEEAIELYFDSRPFELTVVAGCLIGTAGPSPDESPTLPIEELSVDDLIEIKTIPPGEDKR